METLKNGLRVYVYYNLHRHVYSVKALEGGKKGKVVAHMTHVYLENCQFRVGKKGRKRTVDEGRKRVHAGVVGYIRLDKKKCPPREVTYDPFKYEHFVFVEDERPIHNARFACLKNKRVYV